LLLVLSDQQQRSKGDYENMTFTLPSFSYPTSRTDYTNVQNMLISFFTSQGSINAAADAGLALNLKQQGMSDADIVNAILSQDATLQSIANKQRLEAANALAAQAGEVAAVKKVMTDAAAKAQQASGSQSDQKIITVNGVQETRAQAANFGDNNAGVMVANPNDPRGAKITLDQYNKIIAADKLSTGSDTSLIATAPNVSKVVAINGVPTGNATKPQAKSSDVVASPDMTKNLIDQASKAIDTVISPVQAIFENAVKLAQSTGADIQTTVTKALNDAGVATTQEAQNLLKTIGLIPQTTPPTPKKGAPDTKPAPAPSNPVDQITSFFQKLLNMNTGTTTTPTPQPAQPDLLTQIETEVGSFLSTAQTNLNGVISKFTNGLNPSSDPTKSTTPTTSNDNNAPNNITPPDNTTPTPEPPTPQPPNPLVQPTIKAALDVASIVAAAKKYALPIVLISSGVAAMFVAVKLSSKTKGIELNV